MTDSLRTQETADVPSAGNPSPGDRATASECRSGMMGCGMGKKGLKGMLLMAACCGAPVLLLLALPLVGGALGSLGVSAVSTLAALACPIGMGLMMWLMMRAQQAGTQQPAQGQTTVSQAANMATVQPQERAILPDTTAAGEAAVTAASRTQEQVVTPSRSANGYRSAQPTLAVDGQQAVAQPLGNNGIQAVTLPQA